MNGNRDQTSVKLIIGLWKWRKHYKTRILDEDLSQDQDEGQDEVEGTKIKEKKVHKFIFKIQDTIL